MRTFVLDTDEKKIRCSTIIGKLPLKPILQVTVEEYHPKRSSQANRRYWKILELFAKETGHDADELHDILKEKFLGTREVVIAGERYVARPSTKKLSTENFRKYADQVENWGIEVLGIWLE